ncbi:hypothetical protein CYLTODRAFT_234708 [Cylindrobasidium torrendii FP15055 ss-10]|uniref:Uncharacterized protein n=1 Tax=Cylindrobasidium torrendii FP15055 ss-10 TaxID=1314674 RepID=A0A0D7ASB0_9AGAR|nr:hypothetical protein CYLTODRAFT_234708 [Cylindrobasidium torrendii FP15055 ss-10]
MVTTFRLRRVGRMEGTDVAQSTQSSNVFAASANEAAPACFTTTFCVAALGEHTVPTLEDWTGASIPRGAASVFRL